MPDYGHGLLFGALITPYADRAPEALGLARAADGAGLDLLAVPDHPYRPALLEAWTLLAAVAAATARIRVLPDVAALPLRQPAVLAGAAASLDRLSGGRVELGLGAGGYPDEVEAAGGPRRTPGEAVEALAEAVRIIRARWTPGPEVHLDGGHYALRGAPPGPYPAHDMGIWIGGHGPRMLRLTGAVADGWLASAARVPPEALAAGMKLVDEAAHAAGREPAAVRRLYNLAGLPGRGPAEQAERLAELALTHGVSGFLLPVGSAAELERFAAEVAPAVREAVAAERGDGARPEGGGTPSATGPARPAAPGADLWDESTRPTVPGAHTARPGEDVSAGHHLVEVHDHLRGELEQLRELVVQVAGGTLTAAAARSHVATMTLRQHNWSLGAHCAAYCRVVTLHHTVEDQQLFPALRRFDPRLAPVLDRLSEEHLAIHDVLERVDRALVAFVAGPEGNAELRAAVDLLSEALLSHLSYEEHELVAPLARYAGG
ncbi:LLM class flavin-dependent oxidoreductase [Streptomyces sp. MAR4 CNX-425]|uniref:LLM class flavin-dependent oxidoreductase n=1 Tax=Streptomyces sp. MAR4 CNX-425 TaxID=3406343 RepID=UPI003B510AFD